MTMHQKMWDGRELREIVGSNELPSHPGGIPSLFGPNRMIVKGLLFVQLHKQIEVLRQKIISGLSALIHG